MILNLTEKQVPCPKCGIDIDLDVMKYPLDKLVIERCPWCNWKIRILKKLRLKPKEKRGFEFRLSICHEEHRPKWKNQ